MARSHDVRDAFARLAAAEQQFLNCVFLAPVILNRQVQVRIAGVICKIRITPKEFEGWGVFKPTSHSDAVLVRSASLTERRLYLELFPLVRLIIVERNGTQWMAIPANRLDSRFKVEGLIPVLLAEDAQPFEVIVARFDGTQFWFDAADERRDPSVARFFREHLNRLTPPDQVDRPGLTAEERTAYAMAYWTRWEQSEEARQSREERRLRSALAHAGADLKDYVERSDIYTVTYEVDGQRHVSAVAKGDLTVQVAGICLDGEDAKFDLQSLVGVIREGRGDIVRVGEHGMAEDDYWRVHPRR